MILSEAIDFIQPSVQPNHGVWADIGAGSGLFTEALLHILKSGKIIALDKSPHVLYQSGLQTSQNAGKALTNLSVEIMEADFNHSLDLPPLDGILMANALHYANDHLQVLQNVLKHLKPEGTFILIEYELETPNPPWVPNPVPFKVFIELCSKTSLSSPVIKNTRESIYHDGRLYLAIASKAPTLIYL